jgi:NAD(P)H dehydrogenase (quinone)
MNKLSSKSSLKDVAVAKRPIAIPVHSTFGNTMSLAQAIAEGVRAAKEEAIVLSITPAQFGPQGWHDQDTLEALNAAPAIIFGAPTYMGSVSGVYKMFLDGTGMLWQSMAYKDKIAGGFTTSSRASGDKASTLNYLTTYAMQMRMIWVGAAEPDDMLSGNSDGIDQFGFYSGVVGQGSMAPDWKLSAGDLESATRYGHRIAECVNRWRR